MKYGFIFSFILFFAFSSGLYSQNTYSIFGTVIDESTQKPVPGATIKVDNTNIGTYSSGKGKFKLPFLKDNVKLRIKSLGYDSKIIDVNVSANDTIVIKLKPNPIAMKGVQVTEKITANQIIERAIKRKKENLSKLKTFSGLLYSKLVIELNGSVFAGTDGKSVSVSTTIGGQVDKKFQLFLMETFSRTYRDYDKNVTSSEIIQRRQTANIATNDNMLALSSFFNFYDDNIRLFNTDMTTPLSTDALSYYDFELLERTILDDRFIYVIGVKPSSKVFPAFEGTIKIVEGTYNLIELNLKPSQSTAITFVRDLQFNQKFEELQRDIWHPMYLEATGKAQVDIIKGMYDVSAEITATGIYNEATINEPLPDSIYKNPGTRSITVAKLADSTRSEFWDKNAMREISEREKEIYLKVDTLVIKDSLTKSGGLTSTGKVWDWDINPYFDFNRVGSVSLGATPELKYKFITLSATGKYSFGQRKPFGSVDLNLYIPLVGYYRLYSHFSVFSDIAISDRDMLYPPLVNTIGALLFHQDYYDYYKSEGWSADLRTRMYGFSPWANVEFSRQYSLSNRTNRSIFIKREFRANPPIVEGNYRIAKAGLSYGEANSFNLSRSIQFKANISALYGENTSAKSSFRSVEGLVHTIIPLIGTGYSPITLNALLEGGLGSRNLPVQEQYRMNTLLVVYADSRAFYSASTGLFGGTEYFAGHAKLNLTDIWWRWIGLPLYEGRGLDLILAASSAKFFNSSNAGYMKTTPDFYSEAGFGLTRIPTFFSNVIFLSFDARWGVGPISKDRFGWGLSISLPF